MIYFNVISRGLKKTMKPHFVGVSAEIPIRNLQSMSKTVTATPTYRDFWFELLRASESLFCTNNDGDGRKGH
jgi:hypothetical protein